MQLAIYDTVCLRNKGLQEKKKTQFIVCLNVKKKLIEFKYVHENGRDKTCYNHAVPAQLFE